MQNPALKIEGKGKTVPSSRLKNGEQIKKNRKPAGRPVFFISLISHLRKQNSGTKKDLEIIASQLPHFTDEEVQKGFSPAPCSSSAV